MSEGDLELNSPDVIQLSKWRNQISTSPLLTAMPHTVLQPSVSSKVFPDAPEKLCA